MQGALSKTARWQGQLPRKYALGAATGSAAAALPLPSAVTVPFQALRQAGTADVAKMPTGAQLRAWRWCRAGACQALLCAASQHR